jgi:hypothetical protein
MTFEMDFLIGCFQTGCGARDYTVARIHGYTVLLAPIKALSCLRFFPPMAKKSKPPALRVVGDSGSKSKRQISKQIYQI